MLHTLLPHLLENWNAERLHLYVYNMNFGDSDENKFQFFLYALLKIFLLQALIENTFCQNIVELLCILIMALYPNQT